MKQQIMTYDEIDFPLSLTDNAKGMAKKAIASYDNDTSFLRVSIKGGGCSGLQYNLDIDDKPTSYDVRCEIDGLKIVVDVFSLRYLENTNIDYQETLEGAGFKFNNPNARTTCGCGHSFS